MADNLPETMVDAHRTVPRRRRWSFVTDGPPLLLVAVIFAGLLSYWLAPGAPAPLAELLGAAVLVTLALEYRRWGLPSFTAEGPGDKDPAALRRRLDAARGRQIERDRWR